jgi:hypothetical protein
MCDSRKCGSGGCPMTPDACGTCAGGEQCDAAGQCVKQAKCMDCAMNPNGPGGCCDPTKGERCPGAPGAPSVACCNCSGDSCACSDKCTPVCGVSTCGDGGCPITPKACGSCGPASTCEKVQFSYNGTKTCVCRPGCACCTAAGCPAATGCSKDKCTCNGPPSATKKTLKAGGFVFAINSMYAQGCTPPAVYCGGFTDVTAQTKDPLAISYEAGSGFGRLTGLRAFFGTERDGKPLPGKNLFLSFGNASMRDGSCCGPKKPLPMEASITNCTQTAYSTCWNTTSTGCFAKDDPLAQGKCAIIKTVAALGDNSGVWIPNPGVAPFTVIMEVRDDYDQCRGCGNQASGQIYKSGITIEYEE